MVYTFILDTQRKYKIPKDIYKAVLVWGKIAHNIRDKINLNTGANVNSKIFEGVG